jgi:hydrogenase expression/formation protein HypD
LKYIDDYRDKNLVDTLVKKITDTCSKSWTIMEICGGQTHSIMKYNLQELLPSQINLVHGPGCPVCVTPVELIDKAIHLAGRKDVILASFGDMLRVPGSKTDLLSMKANGADIRMFYSPLEVLKIASENPQKKVILFGVGFETTAPAIALTVKQAKIKNIPNFSVLCSHVLVPPAMEAILSSSVSRIQGFLAAGHVCTIMGYHQYIPLAQKYHVPIVITGFEPVDLLLGISRVIQLLEHHEVTVENAYTRLVTEKGNIPAQQLLEEIFEPVDRKWRGIGIIPKSGLALRKEYQSFDADLLFGLEHIKANEPKECMAGQVLQGLLKPDQCPAFGNLCTPEKPLGAPMVSSEGACAAYYRYSGNRKTLSHA